MHRELQASQSCVHTGFSPAGQGQPVPWELGLELLETIPSPASGQEEEEIISFGSVPHFCHPFFGESAGDKLSSVQQEKFCFKVLSFLAQDASKAA